MDLSWPLRSAIVPLLACGGGQTGASMPSAAARASVRLQTPAVYGPAEPLAIPRQACNSSGHCDERSRGWLGRLECWGATENVRSGNGAVIRRGEGRADMRASGMSPPGAVREFRAAMSPVGLTALRQQIPVGPGNQRVPSSRRSAKMARPVLLMTFGCIEERRNVRSPRIPSRSSGEPRSLSTSLA